MRPKELFSLFSDVKSLRGAGPAMATVLAKLTGQESIIRAKDLLFHLPVGIIDRRYSPPISQAKDGDLITITVTVDSHEPPRTNRAGSSFGRPYKVQCMGEGGFLSLVFFRARPDYLTKMLPVGEQRVVSGRFERTDYGWQITHPDFIGTPDELAKIQIIEPLYPLTAGLTNRQLRKITDQVLARLPDLPEWQDPHWMKQKQWPSWKEAWKKLHLPQSDEDLLMTAPARQRIAYDEILANQLALALVRRRLKTPIADALPPPGKIRSEVLKLLPYQLTNAQKEALAEIDADLSSGLRMLRLLQGDVGSGKTVVALLAMLRFAENGKQSALMAPTEMLAQQHYRFIQPLCESLAISAVLLTGGLTEFEQAQIRGKIERGDALIIIGTHSLFQQSVRFHNLGFITVDEQHRFGVEQRMTLADKGEKVHILQMTATPIPRSLTMTAFGDMDVSQITEKPKNRVAIQTSAVANDRMSEVIDGLKRAIEAGERIYWICPLIEESADDASRSDLAAAKARFIEFSQIFGKRVGLLHGRLSTNEREETMRKFANGELQLLVATTVVEVGVDVPDATIMVIEQAERFGLAQLHQLRGRVGRSDKPSHCILLYKKECGETARRRLRTIRDTDDGFLIAEEDLKLRGAGDILGIKQSGVPDFRFADLSVHSDLIMAARGDVKLILHNDPQLQSARGEALRILLYLFEYEENIQLLRAG